MAQRMDLETALVTYLIVFTSAAGIGLLAWLLLVLADMAHAYALAAAGGVGISVSLRRKKG